MLSKETVTGLKAFSIIYKEALAEAFDNQQREETEFAENFYVMGGNIDRFVDEFCPYFNLHSSLNLGRTIKMITWRTIKMREWRTIVIRVCSSVKRRPAGIMEWSSLS